MAKGVKTGGRKAGTPNKVTASFKAAVEMAAEGIGGAERLMEWAKEDPKNERDFWVAIYPKLAPLQVKLTGDVNVHIGGKSADL